MKNKTRKNRNIYKIESKYPKNKTLKNKTMDYSTQFVDVLEQLEDIMKKKGEHFRARAYSRAKETIILNNKPLSNSSQLKGLSGIGETIIKKFEEFIETGTLRAIEKAKNDPMFIFTDVYGIGPKKAQVLVKKHNITSISELRERQGEVLNDVQIKGLKYYEDILKRIPRKEIDSYNRELRSVFNNVKNKKSTMEILGSYRRGKTESGDIDVCISDPNNDTDMFQRFIDALIERKMLVEILSRGNTKSLCISRLNKRKPARRIDFMFTPHDELAFAKLYFTGSKEFNTVMRGRALQLGYSMNEHGLHKMVENKKCDKIDEKFTSEGDVFEFLGMAYKSPLERIDGNSVVIVEKLIDSFKKNGQKTLDALSEEELSVMITSCNKEYYGNDEPLLTDNEYDILKEYTEDKFPENEAVTSGHKVCSISVEKKKATLPYEMWSMDKIKPDTNALKNWLKKFNKGHYVVSGKLDGISALYCTEGSEPKLYTRGNGKVGQDISHAIKYLNLPDTANITIRGELIMKKTTFDTNWSKKFANCRNMIAGTANAKEALSQRWKDIDFVAYEVINPTLKCSDQMKFLEKINVITVKYQVQNKVNNDILSQLLVDWRENYEYEVDGIINCHDKIYPRTSKNPQHAFAFKMVLSDQIVESKVVDVIWSPSVHGYLKPKIQIQPVKIGGATITFATAHNAAFIIKNKIGIGAVVQIIRSGDVIPKVEKVIQHAEEIKMPSDHYNLKWNKTKTDLVLIDSENNDIVKLKNIEAFFTKIGVAGLGRGNIKRIMDAGFDSIEKIITMSIEDFKTVEGFKEKMSNKVYNSIRECLKTVNLTKLMNASNIFARGLGEKKIAIILQEYPLILTNTKLTDDLKIEVLKNLPGFQEKTAKMFVPYISKFCDFMKKINMEHRLHIQKKANIDTSHHLYNKKIVITGFRSKELQERIEKVGGKIGSSVSKNTDIVIVKDIDDDTGKAEKARELNIKIMEVESFIKSYM